LPLLGAAANGIFGRAGRKAPLRAWRLSRQRSRSRGARTGARICGPPAGPDSWTKSYFTWISAGGFRADFALQVDQLTIIMLLVVTGVGWLIHIYSTGTCTTIPVIGDSFLSESIHVFHAASGACRQLPADVRRWEGVGLCSYLLIGFFFLKQSATHAGNKAFWVNRIGDFGFILGLLLILRTFGTLDFATVLPRALRCPWSKRACSQRLPCSCSSARGKIGAASFVRVAAGRDGRPHAG